MEGKNCHSKIRAFQGCDTAIFHVNSLHKQTNDKKEIFSSNIILENTLLVFSWLTLHCGMFNWLNCCPLSPATKLSSLFLLLGVRTTHWWHYDHQNDWSCKKVVAMDGWALCLHCSGDNFLWLLCTRLWVKRDCGGRIFVVISSSKLSQNKN